MQDRGCCHDGTSRQQHLAGMGMHISRVSFMVGSVGTPYFRVLGVPGWELQQSRALLGVQQKQVQACWDQAGVGAHL